MTTKNRSRDWSGRPNEVATPSRLRRGLYAFARAVSWHRRKLAVLCAVAAVLTGLTALAPPRPITVSAVRATTALPGGRILTAGDVRVDQLPPSALPTGAVADPAVVIGKTLAGRVPEGQVLTASNLVGGRSAGSAGRVIAPIRLADADLTALISDGDVVDVLGAEDDSGKAGIVATGVRVVAVPASARDPSAGTAGGGGVILVEVDPTTAAALARAAVGSQLSVIWR